MRSRSGANTVYGAEAAQVRSRLPWVHVIRVHWAHAKNVRLACFRAAFDGNPMKLGHCPQAVVFVRVRV